MLAGALTPAFRVVRDETGSIAQAVLAAACFLLMWGGLVVAAGHAFSSAWRQMSRVAAHPLTFPVLLLTGMLLRVAYACLFAPAPEQDFRTVLNAALRFAADDFGYAADPYFQAWGYQHGMVILEGALLKLSGGFIGFPAAVWLMCSAALGWLVWRIGTGMAQGRHRAGILLGTAFCLLSLPSILYAAVLSNDHPATLLLYGAFTLLLTDRRTAGRKAQHDDAAPPGSSRFRSLLRDAAAGALLACGHLIRPLGVFALLAAATWLVLRPLTNPKQSPLSRLIRVTVVTGVFLLTTWSANQGAMAAGWIDRPMASHDSLYKITVGMNQESRGWYSMSDAQDLSRFPPGPDRRERNLTLIRDRLSDPAAVAGLMLDKFVSFWGDFDGCILWGLGADASRGAVVGLSVAAQFDYAALLLFAALPPLLRNLARLRGLRDHRRGHPPRSRHRPVNGVLLLCRILLIGYVLVHLVFEIQTRYRYFLMPALCLMAADGLPTFVAWARLRRGKRKKRDPAIADAGK